MVQMRRVMVMGGLGSGKSTLAHDLAVRLGVPLLHLDAIYYRKGWVKRGEADFVRELEEFCAGDGWVTDGNYLPYCGVRAARADTLVFVDMPRWVCFGRIVRRSLRRMRWVRSDVPPESKNRVRWVFKTLIWGRLEELRAGILRVAEEHRKVRFVHVKSAAEVAAFLEGVGHGA